MSTPASLPLGVAATLFRGRIKPGMGEEADAWMRMLNERIDEARATLHRERMAIELVFRSREGDQEYLYWVTVRGTSGESVETSDHDLDRAHLAFDERVRERGWVTGDIELVLMPEVVERAVLSWVE
jgi:hypothetical protein